ncbi:unnamed protein product [Strongylus vulgaris]|uniref:Uncharacterized protein n=1 Tax=Strongylus vulgaris TaxID=40348 RepID=A0A3P7IQR5_STRVU|nr:unnamed protein product [Strongylus vulgaris]
MSHIATIAIAYFLITLVHASDTEENDEVPTDVPHNPFGSKKEYERPTRKSERVAEREEVVSSKNNWGFHDGLTEWPERDSKEIRTKMSQKVATTTPYYEEVDPNRNGLLKDIGTINVGFGVGVGVPGNDPVSVGTRVGVGFGASGLAGQLPIGQNIYPRQVRTFPHYHLTLSFLFFLFLDFEFGECLCALII